MDEFDRVADKIEALREGLAARKAEMQPGECPACGAFRLDGKPPEIHEPDCPLRPT